MCCVCVCACTVITSQAEAAAKYCDEHVCSLCVCLSVREDISGTTSAIFIQFLCMLPMTVARSSSGRVTKSQGEGAAVRFIEH